MSKSSLFVIACLLSFSFAVLLNHPDTAEKVSESHINALLSQTFTPDYLEKHIQHSLQDDNVDLAQAYLSLAEMMKLPVSVELKNEVAAQSGFLHESYRQTKAFFSGAITGEGDSSASFTGSVIADFTVIGDVRDLSIETKHYVADEPVDELVAELSAVGLALSAGTVLSWGPAGVFTMPAKASVSLMKYAAKTSRLTKGFKNYLSDVLSRTVSLDPIYKKVSEFKADDKWRVRELTALEKVTEDNVHLVEIKKVSDRVSNIQNATDSTQNTLALLGAVHSAKDLKLMEKFAKLYGKRAAVVLKVVGKKAFRISKFSIKHFAKLFLMILVGFYSLLGVWFSRLIFRKAWRFILK